MRFVYNICTCCKYACSIWWWWWRRTCWFCLCSLCKATSHIPCTKDRGGPRTGSSVLHCLSSMFNKTHLYNKLYSPPESVYYVYLISFLCVSVTLFHLLEVFWGLYGMYFVSRITKCLFCFFLDTLFCVSFFLLIYFISICLPVDIFIFCLCLFCVPFVTVLCFRRGMRRRASVWSSWGRSLDNFIVGQTR